MKKVHLTLKYNFGYGRPTLCGEQSYTYQFINFYLKRPNLDDYFIYDKDYEWCPDCITHPDAIMARLNGTNV